MSSNRCHEFPLENFDVSNRKVHFGRQFDTGGHLIHSETRCLHKVVDSLCEFHINVIHEGSDLHYDCIARIKGSLGDFE